MEYNKRYRRDRGMNRRRHVPSSNNSFVAEEASSSDEQLRKRRRRRNRNNALRSNRGMTEVDHSTNEQQLSHGNAIVEESDIPGFAYDSVTKRYYRVQPQSSGPNIGFRESDLRGIRQHKSFMAERERCCAKSCPSVSWLPKIMQNRELRGSNISRLTRLVTEGALRGVRKEPSYVQKGYTDIEALHSCHYMDISVDGKTIVGCWSVKRRRDEGWRDTCGARIICFKVTAGSYHKIESECRSKFGLKIRSSTYCANLIKSNLMDICVEPINDNVTCALYVTTQTVVTMHNRFSTLSRVCIEPVAEFSSVYDSTELHLPSYNMTWTCQEYVRAIAFNRNRMEIGIGLEENAMLLNISTEQTTRISGLEKGVMSLTFSADGNLLFMGVMGDNVVCSDLRMSNRDVVATYNDTKNVGWLKALRTKPDMLVTEDHVGIIKFWDIRMRKPQFKIEDNINPYNKTPMHLEKDERILFSATSDGITRAWSTYNGEKLCEFPSHGPRNLSRKPKLAYASNLGGLSGNAAILIATGSDFHVHELVL
ncbi:hypothetical protein WUBG_06875 [Wuchereria bancrofti]|uniref:WD_REPEATS_REGION domain-containing protein n=2 Tax=Wuchereria bancrofti TaxID=6293 RepID=J9B5B3_WUCBA|nr:hypothetical protein WUBG_06875 [Wuchereria bancrofti]